ncbi:hypothetical protein [Syntrophomonas curvata]
MLNDLEAGRTRAYGKNYWSCWWMWLGSFIKGGNQDMERTKGDLIQRCIWLDANGFPVRASTTANCKQAIQFIFAMQIGYMLYG